MTVSYSYSDPFTAARLGDCAACLLPVYIDTRARFRTTHTDGVTGGTELVHLNCPEHRPMKALVVKQPWATLIALGVKTIETRPFPPNGPMRPEGVRGLPGCTLEAGERIAIVAGTAAARNQDAPEAWEALAAKIGWGWSTGPDGRDLWDAVRQGGGQRGLTVLGAVVCTATVTGTLPVRDPWDDDPGVWPPEHPCIVPTGRFDDLSAVQVAPGSYAPTVVRSGELPLGDFRPGRWGWLLADPQPCTPIPCTGRQGVFRLPETVAEQVAAQSPRENRKTR